MNEYNAQRDAARAVRVELARRGMNQADLERQLGVTRGTVSRALAGTPLDERSKTWPAILEALGLEVVIRPVEAHSLGAVGAAPNPQELQAGQALLLPPGKRSKARGLSSPVPVEGPAIEELLNEQAGPEQ